MWHFAAADGCSDRILTVNRRQNVASSPGSGGKISPLEVGSVAGFGELLMDLPVIVFYVFEI